MLHLKGSLPIYAKKKMIIIINHRVFSINALVKNHHHQNTMINISPKAQPNIRRTHR